MTTTATPKFAALGSRIRAARNAVRLSQEAFATQILTSRRHVMRLERGDHKPSPPMLDRIAEVTGVSVNDLVGSDDDEESDPVADLFTALRRTIDNEVDTRIAQILDRRDALIEARFRDMKAHA
jgi:transcriptional regulator with XRE-family HTH domain